jgi:hypothetical protein
MKPWPKVAFFIFFRGRRQRPSLLHARKRRPQLTHQLFSAAVAEDGSEIRILTDAAAQPILETEARWIAPNIATLGSSMANTPRSRLMYRNGHNRVRVWVDGRIDPVRLRSVLLNIVKIFSLYFIVIALSASPRSFAAEQASDVPAWLRVHVGEGEGQIAQVVFQRARALYFQKVREGVLRNPCYFAMDATVE